MLGNVLFVGTLGPVAPDRVDEFRPDGRVESLAVLTRLPVEGQGRLHVVAASGPPVGASRQIREDALGA